MTCRVNLSTSALPSSPFLDSPVLELMPPKAASMQLRPLPPVEPRLCQCQLLLAALEPEHGLVDIFWLLRGRQEGPMAQVKIPVNEEVMAGC